MIPFLVVMGALYWLAAPDPVTAGARTASGAAARAAGTGVRDHWASGRDSRALTRTNRRDRWSKSGGFWRNLLRLEHGAVITAKGAKGAAGLTRAAARPVPAAVKAGWNRGQERHRVKAGNRPVPVALDPPWWRREQAQVQPGEQAPERVQVQPGNSLEVQPAEQVRAGAEQAEGTGGGVPSREHPSPPAGFRYVPIYRAYVERGAQKARRARIRRLDSDTTYAAVKDHGETSTQQGWTTFHETGWLPSMPDVVGAVRAIVLSDLGSAARPYRMEWFHDGVHRADDGWSDDAIREAGMAPTDTTTEEPATPTPTEGDPVFTSIDTDLDDLTTVQDFALKVADMAEESDFAQLVEFCKNASDEVRDFGADMAGDVAEFEEVAAKIGDLLSELVDAATKVKDRGAELVGG